MFKVKSGPAESPLKPSLTFPYAPDDFQNHSFNAIESGDHVLVTAHTGSGKTTVAEYAVAYGISLGKKVIYTSPIKALSNQIYGDFRRKYPDWNLGIKTGDIDEHSDDAQVIIMTTEILRNMLLKTKRNEYIGSVSYDAVTEGDVVAVDVAVAVDVVVGIQLEQVGVVIFDEVHWIKDESRGTVWEESIIRMPDHIQMILLSATLPDAEMFGSWIAKCKGRDLSYSTTEKRVVPLGHYIYTSKGKYLIMDNQGNFNHENYRRANEEYDFRPSQLDDYIMRIDKADGAGGLPALFFCFSKKQCQKYANSIRISLVDGKESTNLTNLFDKMVRRFGKVSGLANSAQTQEIRTLIGRAVGFHHAGLLPPLKEIVQELFSQGLIKVLFVTETFAAGVNMPAKTVVFTGFTKIDNRMGCGADDGGGAQFRVLYPEEYGQMAGRAGRRGKDKKGTVIHLPFSNGLLLEGEAREMMCGKIRPIISRFRMDYIYLLKHVLLDDTNAMVMSVKSSLMAEQDDQQYQANLAKLDLVKQELLLLQHEHQILTWGSDTEPEDDVTTKVAQMYQEYLKYTGGRSGKKGKKHYHNAIKPWIEEHSSEFTEYQEITESLTTLLHEVEDLEEICESQPNVYLNGLRCCMSFLTELGYMQKYIEPDQCKANNVTLKGLMAVQVNECNPIMLVELVFPDNHYLDDVNNFVDLVSVLSILLPVRPEEREIGISDKIKGVINRFITDIELIEQVEIQMLDTFSDWTTSYNLCDLSAAWVSGGQLDSILMSSNIVLPGEFVRMMLKLYNICKELYSISNLCHNDHVLRLLDGYQEKIVRDIVVPQSLYVDN